ncbi:MAG: glutamate racemase [Candidatus Doudnabacteria bacterium]|nr:glutamate racemase [Candidatus Doudnabacteria bacterium]
MIGLFDSGIGGLSVVRALLDKHPGSSFVYYGDLARSPYGTKSPAEVAAYARQNVQFLLQQGAESVVIACHTAAAHATDRLREAYPHVPIVSVTEHGIDEVLHASTTGHVVVLGTDGTARSGAHERLLKQSDPFCRVTTIGLSVLVPLIEEGASEQRIETAMRRVLATQWPQDADVALLACTHFPLVQTLFQRVLGPDVFLANPAIDVALKLHPPQVSPEEAVHRYFFSSEVRATTIATQLLGQAFQPRVVTPLA